jgi:hypothetical protein
VQDLDSLQDDHVDKDLEGSGRGSSKDAPTCRGPPQRKGRPHGQTQVDFRQSPIHDILVPHQHTRTVISQSKFYGRRRAGVPCGSACVVPSAGSPRSQSQ